MASGVPSPAASANCQPLIALRSSTLHRRQQAAQIGHGALPWLHPAKAGCNPSTYAIEFPSPISHVLLKRHRRLPLPADLNT
jgi:hypothetical protein